MKPAHISKTFKDMCMVPNPSPSLSMGEEACDQQQDLYKLDGDNNYITNFDVLFCYDF